MAGILLAAGQGSRLGRPKALVEIGGQALVTRGIALLRAGGADPVIVVTGAASVDLAGVILVHNPDWRTGMGSSLRAGLATLPDSCDAAVIALVDQPLISPEAVRRLIGAFLAGAGVVVASYDGQPRNPVLLARVHWAGAASAAVGDTGARQFLRAHPELVTQVECGDVGRADDIDTPADLERVAGLESPPGDVEATEVASAAHWAIRPATSGDAAFLTDMLIEAVNWSAIRALSRPQIMASPQTAHYVTGWPGPTDLGVIAEAGGEPVAAAWLRFFADSDPGYGFVSADVPELSIGVVPSWRGRGVGRALLRALAEVARSAGIDRISLSVERENHARNLYLDEGYQVVDTSDDSSDTMIKDL